MARRIIIHAGQHKTGSTSIQRYLAENADFLRERNIAVGCDWTPNLARLRTSQLVTNAKFIANAVVRNSLDTPLRIRGSCRALAANEWRAGLGRINAYLRGLAEETVILSAEAFAFLRQPGEMRRLQLLCDGLDWRAIMFLREPKSWLQSWSAQISHTGLREAAGVNGGGGIFDLGEASWLVDHDAIRAFWGGRCTFLSYEDTMAGHQSVIPALLAEIGLDPQACPGWDGFFANATAARQAPVKGV